MTFDSSHRRKDVGAATFPLILDICHEATIPPINGLGKVFCLKLEEIAGVRILNQGLFEVVSKSLFYLGIGEIRVFTEIPLWLNLGFAEHLIVHHDINGENGLALRFI